MSRSVRGGLSGLGKTINEPPDGKSLGPAAGPQKRSRADTLSACSKTTSLASSKRKD